MQQTYSDMSEVPFYRRQWFFWITLFTVPFITLFVLFSGSIHYERKGEIKEFGFIERFIWISIIIGVLNATLKPLMEKRFENKREPIPTSTNISPTININNSSQNQTPGLSHRPNAVASVQEATKSADKVAAAKFAFICKDAAGKMYAQELKCKTGDIEISKKSIK